MFIYFFRLFGHFAAMSQEQISKAEELLELITAPVSSSNQGHGPQPGPQVGVRQNAKIHPHPQQLPKST